MSDATRTAVDGLLRRSAQDALECGIDVGERADGSLLEYVVHGAADAARRLRSIRGDAEQLKKSGPYQAVAQHASELHRFPQLISFVQRQLIAQGRLDEPMAFDVRTVAAEMPTDRKGCVGNKRPGVIAIANYDARSTAGARWSEHPAGYSGIDHEHVIDLDQPPPGEQRNAVIDKPLTRLLEALTTAHPHTPIVVDELDWPIRSDTIISYDKHWPDISSQLALHRDRPIVFRCEAPERTHHFKGIDGSDLAPGLQFAERNADVRLIQMLDAFGRYHYFRIPRSSSCTTAVEAVCKVERERIGLGHCADQFRSCGVLTGNASSTTAIAARAACVQIRDLLALANTDFDH
jgi:hypothetical protein